MNSVNGLDGFNNLVFYNHKNHCEICNTGDDVAVCLPRKVIWFLKKKETHWDSERCEFYVDLCDSCYDQLDDNILHS